MQAEVLRDGGMTLAADRALFAFPLRFILRRVYFVSVLETGRGVAGGHWDVGRNAGVHL